MFFARYANAVIKDLYIPTGATHAAQRITDQHDRCGPGLCAGAGFHCHAPAAAGPGGLPAGGRHHRPFHAGLRGGCGNCRPAGGNRRHAADVRGGSAFLHRRTALRAQAGPARGGGADRGGHAAGHGPGFLVGLEHGCCAGLWPVAVGGQYGGAAAGAGDAQPARHFQRPRGGRLAGGGRPGDGAGAGAAAACGSVAGG